MLREAIVRRSRSKAIKLWESKVLNSSSVGSVLVGWEEQAVITRPSKLVSRIKRPNLNFEFTLLPNADRV